MNLPSRENICAVVISYNPDHVLMKELNAIVPQVAEVLIVDNASSEKNILQEIEKQYPDVTVIYNSKNEGIAAALNTGIEAAIQKGYSWIVQLDQDSLPENDLVVEMCRCASLYKKENLAMIGCNYYTMNKALIQNSSDPFKEVLTLITSGSLLSADAFRKCGMYRDDFFIDAVDFEYSLRLKKAGFRSIITTKPLMHHSIGSAGIVNFGFLKLHSTNHSPIRRYYRARNTMLLAKQYFTSFPFWILKYNFFLMLSTLLIILLEKDKAPKIKSIFKGIRDGIKK